MKRRRRMFGKSRAAYELVRLGHQQAALAERLGVGQGTISKWLAGTHDPDHVHRQRIFEAYGIEPEAWRDIPRLRAAREGTTLMADVTKLCQIATDLHAIAERIEAYEDAKAEAQINAPPRFPLGTKRPTKNPGQFPKTQNHKKDQTT